MPATSTKHNNRPSVSDWQQAGGYTAFQKYAVYRRHSDTQASDGKPHLLLIHGFPTASWDWHCLWPELAEQFELSAVDMLGFGLSDKPPGMNYTIAGQADLQEFILAQRGVGHTHLLVHDYGVSVAQELLARQLEGQLEFRIDSCIFLNGGLFHGIHKPLPIQHLLASRLGPLLSPFMGKSALRRSMRRILAPDFQPDEWDIEQMWSLIERQNGKRALPRISRYMHERKRFYQRWLQALTEAQIPLRLIDGMLDPISGAALAHAYRELIPNPDVIELHDTGHYPQLENPAAVLGACMDFWRGLQVIH